MTNTENTVTDSEHESKSKNTAIVSRVPREELQYVDQIDEIAVKQKRSRSYVAWELLKKALGNFKGETL